MAKRVLVVLLVYLLWGGRVFAIAGTITATPNPCTLSGGLCTSTIAWSTSGASTAVVFVQIGSGARVLLACGSSGSVDAPWIQQASYLFTLYPASSCEDRPTTGLLASVAATGLPPPAPPVVIETINYAHWSIGADCSLDDTGILLTYHQPGVRAIVQSQLAAMRAAGVTGIRTIIWHLHDATGQRWGVIPSGSGLVSPSSTNLSQFAADIAAAGFSRWTLAFGPMGTNDPIQATYDPARFAENWSFVQQVRTAALVSGPSDTRFDLLSEGGPSLWWPQYAQLVAYAQAIWHQWVSAFGAPRASISSIIDDDYWDAGDRLRNLIVALRATGDPLPTWFDAHMYGVTVAADLTAVDQMLTAEGVSQPITVLESYYHDAPTRAAVTRYQGAHTLTEFGQWPLTMGYACTPVNTAPPYTP